MGPSSVRWSLGNLQMRRIHFDKYRKQTLSFSCFHQVGQLDRQR